MCTVSTAISGSNFVVTMNRDERRTRLEGPLFRGDTCSFPTDQLSGGTWCGINQQGVVLCLLNRYDAPVSSDASIVSRGNIIPQALEYTSVRAMSDFIAALPHEQYNGFQLLILSPNDARVHHWDRTEHRVERRDQGGGIFASSSSLRSDQIPQQRAERFRTWQRHNRTNLSGAHPGTIPAIHLRDATVPPSESIFMVRRDTHTKSICQLSVGERRVSLHYWPAQTGWKQSVCESWGVNR